MAEDQNASVNIETVKPSFSFVHMLLIILAAQLGAFAAIQILPLWIPGLSSSITGTDPKVFWYLSRGSAFSAYFLLWLSMMFGVGITNKLASLWPGLPPTIDLHQYTSILGLAFAFFHGLILLGDAYMSFQIAQIFVPFTTTSYKPVSVGIGQTGIYLWAIITLSFYTRKKIGAKTWRLIHFTSFLMFASALIHGILSGTDSSTPWAITIYTSTGFILLVMIIIRIIRAMAKRSSKKI